jgi:hypothetical protein
VLIFPTLRTRGGDIEDIVLKEKAQTLTLEQVRQWEQRWGRKTEPFEMMGGAGLNWTTVEQQAGAERTRDLTQDDAGPQTIFRVVVKPDAPLLVKVQLRYRAKSKRKEEASR